MNADDAKKRSNVPLYSWQETLIDLVKDNPRPLSRADILAAIEKMREDSKKRRYVCGEEK